MFNNLLEMLVANDAYWHHLFSHCASRTPNIFIYTFLILFNTLNADIDASSTNRICSMRRTSTTRQQPVHYFLTSPNNTSLQQAICDCASTQVRG